MLDPTRLLRLISSKTATGICVAALATGAGTIGVMAAVGGSGPASETTTSSTSSTTTTSHAPTSRSETETSETETSETHTTVEKTETETSETESSETGDKDAHGDAVEQGVKDCKAAAAKAGEHGIGHCVSQIAHSSHEDGDSQGQNHDAQGHDD
jgi:cytoskeletal protein RodZ